jgi:hypothetical protein
MIIMIVMSFKKIWKGASAPCRIKARWQMAPYSN